MRILLALCVVVLIAAVLMMARPARAAELQVYAVDPVNGLAVVRIDELQAFVDRFNAMVDALQRASRRVGTCS